MNSISFSLFWPFAASAFVLFIIGIYCMLFTYNLVRALIGLEILIKAATLLIIAAGYLSGHVALAQSLVITLIVIEAALITIGVGIVLGIHRHYKSLDARNIKSLRG